MSTSGGETRFSGEDSSDLSGGEVSLLSPDWDPTATRKINMKIEWKRVRHGFFKKSKAMMSVASS